MAIATETNPTRVDDILVTLDIGSVSSHLQDNIYRLRLRVENRLVRLKKSPFYNPKNHTKVRWTLVERDAPISDIEGGLLRGNKLMSQHIATTPVGFWMDYMRDVRADAIKYWRSMTTGRHPYWKQMRNREIPGFNGRMLKIQEFDVFKRQMDRHIDNYLDARRELVGLYRLLLRAGEHHDLRNFNRGMYPAPEEILEQVYFEYHYHVSPEGKPE